MGSDNYQEQQEQAWIDLERNANKHIYMHKFKLYETRSNFYMIGWDKSKTFWKVLKIDRSEPSELNILQDSATYSETECCDLLQRIHEGNKSTGGLKFVTICYGIVGCINFLGPYYLLLITKRRKIGVICGHAVYSIIKSEMIQIPSSVVQSNKAYSKNENRYKKLLRTVDLTKDFFFSYSYHLMLSLQKNLSNYESGLGLYETMFVWNEYLTRGIRNQLKNSLWTVALVHGFFKQVKLSLSGRHFWLALIARRSRHYAGTRYLKRGVNEKGRVANDVETEQIVLEDDHEARFRQISSVVQNRGSIPLFWSQETSRLNIKPDILLSRKDNKYEATKLHFENLVKRYGNPIIILNLIRMREKKPRESILRAEFSNAIAFINKDLTEENRLKFLHWDLSKNSRKARSALKRLVEIASYAMDFTGFFYCQVIPNSRNEDSPNWSSFVKNSNDYAEKDALDMKIGAERFLDDVNNNSNNTRGDNFAKPPMFQTGVLRTNCIDCLDRTNVAQYAYGVVALGHQLHALGLISVPTIDMDSPLADGLMRIYEEMGDTLALQYGGSPAHNKIFSERRGQWKAATQSQEFFRTLQRYYSNAYMDGEKQDAINVFLGHFQPQLGKPALWELDSDQHYNVGRHGCEFADENSRLMIKRSLSDGNILCQSNSIIEEANIEPTQDSYEPLPDKGLSDSSPEISTCESNISYSRYTPSMCSRKLFQVRLPDLETDGIYFRERREPSNCSNFLDVDWLSSSANSCEEDTYERSTLLGTSSADLISYGDANEFKAEASSSSYGSRSSLKGKEQTAGKFHLGAKHSSQSLCEFSETFTNWVIHGDMLFP